MRFFWPFFCSCSRRGDVINGGRLGGEGECGGELDKSDEIRDGWRIENRLIVIVVLP